MEMLSFILLDLDEFQEPDNEAIVLNSLESNNFVRCMTPNKYPVPTSQSQFEITRENCPFDYHPITKKLHNNLVKYQKFPSDYIQALFCSHSYYDLGKSKNKKVSFEINNLINSQTCSQRNEFLKDWKIVEIFENSNYPYLGVLYVNLNQNQVVLASRGAHIQVEDLFNEKSPLKKDPKKFLEKNFNTSKILEYMKMISHKIYKEWVQNKGFSLSLTGHGIGGWYSGLIWFNLPQVTDRRNVKVVAFDSPGDQYKIEDSYYNHVTYLSNTNFLNTCSSHKGLLYSFNIDKDVVIKDQRFSELIGSSNTEFLNFMINGFYCFNQVGIENLITYFDKDKGKTIYERLKTTIWPEVPKWLKYSPLFDLKINSILDGVDLICDHIFGYVTHKKVEINEKVFISILVKNTMSVDLKKYQINKSSSISVLDFKILKEKIFDENLGESYISDFIKRLRNNIEFRENGDDYSIRIKDKNEFKSDREIQDYLEIESIDQLNRILLEIDFLIDYLNENENERKKKEYESIRDESVKS
ncbi:unnamed protein product [Brachionus calyciflorus]|uniref:Uncharacterized protein n=1 Tax=Brachionus calyciflorus TaxID=104777 RepID=A0A814CVI3_9BILA|nr:unnamed protein product [Brachionus calyciflorus]